MNRNRLAAALCLAALTACGGGALLALVPIVGPIGGSWAEDGDPTTPDRDATTPGGQSVAGETFSAESTDPANYPADPSYQVSGNLLSAVGPCKSPDGNEIPITGDVDADLLVLRNGATECLRARFIDLRTLDVEGSTRRFRNTTPRIDLTSHVWLNADDASQRFTFTQGAFVGDDATDTIAGCRGSGAGALTVGGTIAGYDSITKVGPEVPLLTVGGTAFVRGSFRGASEIQFGPNGGPALTLRRTIDKPVAGTCPP